MARAETSIARLLLRLAAMPPPLLAEHGAAYGALLAAELERLAAAARRRAWLDAVALAALAAGLALAGVAAMLWAVLPIEPMRAPWLLVLVPLLPVLAAICCAGLRRRRGAPAFDELLRQLQADGAMLREAAAS